MTNQYAVVLGSLNMDVVIRGPRLPAKGESVLGASFNTYPGGKGANQAVQLARLGLETYMLGRVGADVYGDQLLESLRHAGVHTDFIIRDSVAQTGIGCVFVDDAADNYIIVIPQANMNWGAHELDAARDLVADAALLLCQLETPVAIVVDAIHSARAAGVATILNAAPARELPGGLLAPTDLLILNESESDFYLGGAANAAADPLKAARRLRRLGSDTVVITLGDQGAVAVDSGAQLAQPAFPVAALDVTAAGDAFCGGLAFARATGMTLRAGLRFANACGALATTRPGAQPSLPTRQAVEALLARTGEDDDV